MGETGKRTRLTKDTDGDEKSQKRRFNNKDNSGDGELVVYRILCPESVIGRVIGKWGMVIKNLRQETRSKIQVFDLFPGANERVIAAHCHVRHKDDVEVDVDYIKPLCPAQYALLKVHAVISNAVANVADSDKNCKVEAHILVPGSQVARVIGKSGSTIKKLTSKTRANIKVTRKDPNDPTHSCAMDFDTFVLITGDAEAVMKALFAVSAIMYKFSPREDISLVTTMSNRPPSISIPSDVPREDISLDTTVSDLPPSISIPSDVPREDVSLDTAVSDLPPSISIPSDVPWEDVSLDTTIPDLPPSISIPSDVPMEDVLLDTIVSDLPPSISIPSDVPREAPSISIPSDVPSEDICPDTTVPDLSPSISIPSDVPIYPTRGLYHGSEAMAPPATSVSSVMGTTQHIPDLQGYADTPRPISSSALPVVSGCGGPSQSENLILRVLCPSDKIGCVIGKGGSSIKYVKQATGARIEIEDAKNDRDECVITVTSTEHVDDLKSTAVEAVLLLQGKINEIDNDDNVSICLLVPSKNIGCLIGKDGSIINEICKRTKADVRIVRSEKPSCADSHEELVEVVGKVVNVRDALVKIILRLRNDALKDREGGRIAPAYDYVYSSGLSVPPSVLAGAPLVASLGYDQHGETESGLGEVCKRAEADVCISKTEKPSHDESHEELVEVIGEVGSVRDALVQIILRLRDGALKDMEGGCSAPADDSVYSSGENGNGLVSICKKTEAAVRMSKSEKPSHADSHEKIIEVIGEVGSVRDALVQIILRLREYALKDREGGRSAPGDSPVASLGYDQHGETGSGLVETHKRTEADVHISKIEKPSRADNHDELIEGIGEVGSVKDALVQIILRLREYVLKHRKGGLSAPVTDSAYSSGLSEPSVLPTVPPVVSLCYDQQVEIGSRLGMVSTSNLDGYGPLQDREGGCSSPAANSIYSSGLSEPIGLPTVPPVVSLGYDQQVKTVSGLSLLSSSNLDGYGSLLDRKDGFSDPAIDSRYSGGLSTPSVISSVPSVVSLGYDQQVETGSGLGMLSTSNPCGLFVPSVIPSVPPGFDQEFKPTSGLGMPSSSNPCGYGSLQDRKDGCSAPAIDSGNSSGLSAPSVIPSAPPGFVQQVETGSGLDMLSTSNLYGYGSLQVGETCYGSIPSYLLKSYGGLTSSVEVTIPANAVGKVMGRGESNITNIRKIKLEEQHVCWEEQQVGTSGFLRYELQPKAIKEEAR
ncbi:uncharacterized protein LOC143854282 isoform X2 [Tasmannia lanceolata]|uniref:uncharacterized protein LOC143854282 isoform X2 n=1 Tax=Tasmannia lanceolata TaxID=3420 RepID=UPI0040643941